MFILGSLVFFPDPKPRQPMDTLTHIARGQDSKQLIHLLAPA